MKTIHVVVEGRADQLLFEKLLEDLNESARIQVHVAEGKLSAHPLARTLQVRQGEPVALVLDADTTDRATAEQEQAMYESYLNFTSKGVPFIVILIKPSVEEIFFEFPEFLSDITGKTFQARDMLAGRAAPKMYLSELGVNWMKSVPTFTERHLETLRNAEPIAAFRRFVHEVKGAAAGIYQQKNFNT